MIVSKGEYYLYRHIRLDKNQPFYIGIAGKKADRGEHYYRGNRVSNRNAIWRDIYNACNKKINIEILIESDSLDFIKEKEKEFIAVYGRKNNNTGILSNMTDGGDGAIGTVATEQSRKRQSLGQINSTKTRKKGNKLPDWWKDKIRQTKFGERNPQFGKIGSLAKKVINVITEEVFDSIILASERVKLHDRLLHQYLSGHRVNKSPFVYLSTYEQMGSEYCLSLINQTPKTNKGRKVIDVATNKVYSTAAEAAKDFNWSVTYIQLMLAEKCKNKTTLKFI